MNNILCTNQIQISLTKQSKHQNMKLLKEFKNFAVKGNMIDIAIGIIMGTAFNKVIDVLVKKVVMPPFLYLLGNIDLEDIKLVLKGAVLDDSGKVIQEELAISFGLLIEVSINFLILGASMFAVVKLMNKLKSKSEDEKDTTVPTPKDIELMTTMTELMKEQNDILKAKA